VPPRCAAAQRWRSTICNWRQRPRFGDSLGREGETLDDYINRVEKQAILEALTKTDFNRTAAARLLGVSFRSLRYRIERLGIEE
jgi:transcriptional regulator with GAF, ATPase, and Fis domain